MKGSSPPSNYTIDGRALVHESSDSCAFTCSEFSPPPAPATPASSSSPTPTVSLPSSCASLPSLRPPPASSLPTKERISAGRIPDCFSAPSKLSQPSVPSSPPPPATPQTNCHWYVNPASWTLQVHPHVPSYPLQSTVYARVQTHATNTDDQTHAHIMPPTQTHAH